MIYLDTSALVKLVFDEAESEALVEWLAEREGIPKVTSALSTVELLRVCRWRDELALGAARQVLGGVDVIPLTDDIVEQAGVVGRSGLRTLGALHLASALVLGADLSAFVAYDTRLLAAAASAGVPTASPSPDGRATPGHGDLLELMDSASLPRPFVGHELPSEALAELRDEER